MGARPPLPARGFTLLELAVAAGLLALLVLGLVTRVQFYQSEGERVAAQQLVGNLRTALAVRAAQALATEGEAGLTRLAGENPVGWLSGPPANYLGEFYTPGKAELPAGNWYFDRGKRNLVYLPLDAQTIAGGEQNVLAFRLALRSSAAPGGGETRKVNQAIVLEQVAGRGPDTSDDALVAELSNKPQKP